MKCPECNTENESLAKVCKACDASLDIGLYECHGHKPLPQGLKGFNWGAFFLPVFWCLENRLWRWLLIFILLDILFVFFLFNWDNGSIFYFLPLLRLGVVIYFGFRGNELAWSKRKHKDIFAFKRYQSSFLKQAVFLFIVSVIIIRFGMVDPHSRPKSNFTACVQMLKNIRSGLEQQISEMGGLQGITSENDVCHHILPGYDKPKECYGKIKGLINELCLQDSYSITILDEYHYEIRAQSIEKAECKICVTESGVRPDHYDPDGACREFTCVHSEK